MTGSDPALATTPDASPGVTGRVAWAVGSWSLVLLLVILAVFAVEGIASFYLLATDLRSLRARRENERPHTTYDTLLGWVNRPSAVSPDEYGKGIGLTTDPQGFRGGHALSAEPKAGTVRIACSGDSFTLGYGVDDASTWCARLESLLPGVETMNLGQGAYGIDQAYLWYARDGVKYRHALQIVALTYVQFDRALSTSFVGRFKPVLDAADGRLVARGVPVPPQTNAALRNAYAVRLFEELRALQWLRRFSSFNGTSRVARDVDARWPLFDAIFAALAEGHRQRGSHLVIVYLPTPKDRTPGPLDARRARSAQSAAAHGIPFIDLTDAMRAMRPDSSDLAFISRAPAGAAPGVPGHYTKLGNDWVARQLAARLREVPNVGALFVPVPSRPAAGRAK